MKRHLTLLVGTASKKLGEKVATHLNEELTPINVKSFNDGETYIRINKSVRGSHVFVIQSTSPPVNDSLMELLITVDALKRASAKEITAVIPYFGYARQDRKSTSREPITAKLAANLLESAGVNRVVTFDLHVDQIQGFFNIPVDNLGAMPILARPIIEKKLKNAIIVSPDVGGAKRARRFAELLGVDMAIIDKRRTEHGKSEIMNLIGEVKGKTAILIDDIIDTAGTISNAASELAKRGAKDVYICATHALFSKDAVEKLGNKDIKEIIITDTIELPKEKITEKIKAVSLSKFLAELIDCIFEGSPMGVIVEGKKEGIKIE
ncbi:ribose-phosphate diphosphokinase [Candidatus Woesearchaeota archaeon]|nr:ribose-phosphate diphosphokinase [Candidatus Woesearchaeota archaeon]